MGNLCDYNHQEMIVTQRLPKQIKFHKYMNMMIFLDEGDIKEQEVDVIVCQNDVSLSSLPSSFTYNMKPQIQAQLLADIQKLKTNKNHVFGDVVYTHAPELDFDYIFYCLLPSDQLDKLNNGTNLTSNEQEQLSPIKQKKSKQIQSIKGKKQYITDCIIKCMNLAEEQKVNSICLPVFESYMYTLSQLATIMLASIKNYIEENSNRFKSLNTVRICVQDYKQLESFTWAFQEVFKKVGVQQQLSDNNSESMSDTDPQEIEESLRTIKDLNLKRSTFMEDELFSHFGKSYSEKISGGQSMGRKGSI